MEKSTSKYHGLLALSPLLVFLGLYLVSSIIANDFYKIKGGVLEGKASSVEELTTLAQLPSREELIAKLAGCLLANVSKLAATLDAVRVKKEEEAK